MITRRSLLLSSTFVVASSVRSWGASPLGNSIRDKAAELEAIADNIDLLSSGSAGPSGSIVYPIANDVYQMNSLKVASFRASWRGAGDNLKIMQGSKLITESKTGNFNNIPAGAYQMVLEENGAAVDTVNFGVGLVFLVAGQSDAVSPLQPESYVLPVPAPQRVIVSDYYRFGFDAMRDVGLDPLVADWANNVFAAGSCWVHAAVTMNKSYPIKFVIVAQGNTSTSDWVNKYMSRIFEAVFKHSPTAILWQQGPSDAIMQMTQEQSFSNMNAMVRSLREVSLTPWVVALDSRYPQYAPIRAAQQQLIEAWPHVLQGPDVDTVRGTTDEYEGPQLEAQGVLWGNTLLSLGF